MKTKNRPLETTMIIAVEEEEPTPEVVEEPTAKQLTIKLPHIPHPSVDLKSTRRRVTKTVAVPVAVVGTTLGVLTNPFRKDRHSALGYFSKTMARMTENSLEGELKACTQCHLPKFSVLTERIRVAGETRSSQGPDVTSNYCEHHRPIVAAYQASYLRRNS